MVISFLSPAAKAITSSIIDTFTDENLIASRQNVNIDTLSGQTKTPTYSWSSTFSYASNNYAVSSHYNSSISWETIIPGYSNSINPSGNGNVGAKGQTWCNGTLITSGWENDFSDWFIPNIGELDAGGFEGWSSTTTSPAYRALVNPGDYWLKGGTWKARPVRVVTALQGNLVSTNLLDGESVHYIDSFGYNASVLPSGTTLKVQFSQDGSTWYNSSGTSNGWDTLSLGTNEIDLTSLAWEDPNFYYKMQFTTNSLASSTPVLDEISLNYDTEQVPEPASLLLLGFGVAGIAIFRKKIKGE